MGTYQYTALNTVGQRVEGRLTAASEQAALAELESRRLTPVAVSERLPLALPAVLRRGQRGVSSRRLGESYEQMGDLLHAGVPLLRALRLLGARKNNPRLAECFRSLADEVEKGSDLATAMQERARVFPPVHVAMVRAGERGSFLEQVLTRLGGMVTREAELRSKLVGNLIYPGVLVTLGAVVMGIIFGFFVPKFRPMLSRLGDELPGVTRFIFFVSDAMGKFGWVTLIVIVLLLVGAWRALREPAVRARLERVRLRAPVVGPVLRNFATARLCSMLGAMLANGVPMLAALTIAKEGTGSALLRDAVSSAAEAVRAGQPLAPALAECGLIDDDALEMIRVGEVANNLDEVLEKTADTIERRLDRQLQAAIRLVEPLMLLVIAGIVGVVALGLLLPLSKLSGAV